MGFEQNQKIVVIGDLILDEFVFGSVDRINPEAPIPILNIKRNEFRLGGASNVANNIVKSFLYERVPVRIRLIIKW